MNERAAGGALKEGNLAARARAWNTEGVMDGESTFSRTWDIVTSVLLVFVAVVTPFELGFLETRIDTAGGLALFVVNRAVDLVGMPSQVEIG